MVERRRRCCMGVASLAGSVGSAGIALFGNARGGIDVFNAWIGISGVRSDAW